MSTPKSGTIENKTIHYSVGALIEYNGKYLLIDRVKVPLGFAGLAGHIDEGETAEQALLREVKEESGLTITNHKLLIEELVDWNECSYGVKGHHWYVFSCEVSGKIERSQQEAKSINWYSKEELSKLNLEPVWKLWFEKLGII